MTKPEVGIHHSGRLGRLNNVRFGAGFYFADAEMLQVQVQIAKANVANSLSLGVHNLFGNDRGLHITGARARQRVHAE
jgi:hypothetical protein